MEKGFWNSPVPADPPPVLPRILLAPVVGFDRDCYRLGYGAQGQDTSFAREVRASLERQVGRRDVAAPDREPVAR